MKPTLLHAISIALACLALLLAWFRIPSPTRPAPTAELDRRWNQRLEAEEQRFAALERELAELGRSRPQSELQAPDAGDRALAAPAVDPTFADRVAELEAQLARLSQQLSAPRAAAQAERGTGTDRAREAHELQFLARDATRSEQERLRALGTLRGRRLADGTDARLGVLDEMIELAQRSTDGETRADVWRQLSHVTDRRLEQPLLDALALDTHAKAREEAAETLADFLPNPRVQAALEHARNHDADGRVRAQAAHSLYEGKR